MHTDLSSLFQNHWGKGWKKWHLIFDSHCEKNDMLKDDYEIIKSCYWPVEEQNALEYN